MGSSYYRGYHWTPYILALRHSSESPVALASFDWRAFS